MADEYVLPWDEADPLGLYGGESTQANQALHDYAELGPGRSLSQLAGVYRSQIEGGSKPPAKSISTLRGWSAAHHWQDRVAAADDLARKAERAAAAAVRAERARELAERNWSLSSKLASRVEEMLGFPLAQVEQITKRRQGPDGRTTEIHMNVVKPGRWSFQTAAIMADIAAKLGALAAGEPTERTAHALEGLNPRDLESMPIEQLLALRAQIEKDGR